MQSHASTRRHPHRRRAASYVFFLGTAMLVTVIGLSSLMLVRVQRRGAETANDMASARFYAQSAIEYGFARINEDPDWRTTLGTGTWVNNQAIGSGYLELKAEFVADGDANPDNDPLVLKGRGYSGPAEHRAEVTVIVSGDELIIQPGSWTRVED